MASQTEGGRRIFQFPFIHHDPHREEMEESITYQADGRWALHCQLNVPGLEGLILRRQETPLPWLTFVVLRLLERNRGGEIIAPEKA